MCVCVGGGGGGGAAAGWAIIYSSRNETEAAVRAQELCESRGGRPGLPVPNSPHSLCGRETTLSELKQQTG